MAYVTKGKNKNKPYTVKYMVDGKRKEASFRTSREASDFMIKYEHDSRAQTFTDPRNGSTPFCEYAGQWIESLDRAAGTRKGYAGSLRTHIAPAVNGRSLAQVAGDREGFAGLLASLRDEHSGATASMARSVILGAVNEAVASGRISSHRLAGVTVRRPAVKRADIIPASHDQLAAMAAGMRPGQGLAIWLMTGTGMRVNECLAVRLSDFTDDGRVLRVQRQNDRHNGGETAALKARRDNEGRDVPVPAWLWAMVGEHVATYGTGPAGEIFPGAKYGSFADRLASRACRAGLPNFTSHHLRHLYVSHLLTAGIPITDVAAWVGHRDVNVTMSTYGHLLPDSYDRAREALESLAD